MKTLTRKIRKNTTDKLTHLVIQYRRTKDDRIIKELMNGTEKLIYGVMKYYRMDYFPKLYYQEVVETCKGEILLRAIKGFDKDKSTKFSTYYVWKLKSHVRYRQQFLLRRKKLVEHISLNTVIAGGGGHHEITIEDISTNFNKEWKGRVSHKISEIFSIK